MAWYFAICIFFSFTLKIFINFWLEIPLQLHVFYSKEYSHPYYVQIIFSTKRIYFFILLFLLSLMIKKMQFLILLFLLIVKCFDRISLLKENLLWSISPTSAIFNLNSSFSIRKLSHLGLKWIDVRQPLMAQNQDKDLSIKINAKAPLKYTLTPETNSDSPSTKSLCVTFILIFLGIIILRLISFLYFFFL